VGTVHKEVHRRLGPGSATLQEILDTVEELQRLHPDREVFYDGDEGAICSRPRRKPGVVGDHGYP
jgi:hypothetical protein